MGIIELILVFLAALLVVSLILAEIFFIPGFGLLGIMGILGFLGIGAYIISLGELTLVIVYGILSIILFILGFVLLSRNKFYIPSV